MKINWEQWSDLRNKLRDIGEDLFETRNKTIDINCKIDQVLRNQQEELCKAHGLVVLYNGVTDIKVYEHGKDITKGITSITIRLDRPPVIEYEKVITDETD
jgi:hypothetical protein